MTASAMCRCARFVVGVPGRGVRAVAARLAPPPVPAGHERVLRELLRLAANTVQPSDDALDAIRDRTSGAPREGGAAHNTDDDLRSHSS